MKSQRSTTGGFWRLLHLSADSSLPTFHASSSRFHFRLILSFAKPRSLAMEKVVKGHLHAGRRSECCVFHFERSYTEKWSFKLAKLFLSNPPYAVNRPRIYDRCLPPFCGYSSISLDTHMYFFSHEYRYRRKLLRTFRACSWWWMKKACMSCPWKTTLDV